MNKTDIARVAHEVNAAFCRSIGDSSQPAWADAPEWQQKSILAGVDMHLANPDATPEDSHLSWLAQKEKDGWTFGPIKDAAKKEHPCMRPYAELPEAQRSKDHLFKGVVHALAPHLKPEGSLEPTTAVRGNAANAPGEKIAMPAPVIGGLGGIPVQYIGKRAEYKDGTYRSGLVWAQGEIKQVPAALAAQLLRHTDQYKLGTIATAPATDQAAADLLAVTEATVKSAAKDAETDQETHDLEDARRSINTMNRTTLANYAKANFGQHLDPKTMEVAEMRATVARFLDQFGLPGTDAKAKG